LSLSNKYMDITPPASSPTSRNPLIALVDYSSDDSIDSIHSVISSFSDYARQRYQFYQNSPVQGPFGYGSLSQNSPSKRASSTLMSARSKRLRASVLASGYPGRANQTWDKFTWLKKPF